MGPDSFFRQGMMRGALGTTGDATKSSSRSGTPTDTVVNRKHHERAMASSKSVSGELRLRVLRFT
jgi:hypothetical protein